MNGCHGNQSCHAIFIKNFIYIIGWLVGWFGFNGPLRQYFSLYRAVSQREGERRETIDESKNVQTTPTRTYCKRNRPLPYCNQNCRTPRHWKFTQHHRTTRPPPYVIGTLSLIFLWKISFLAQRVHVSEILRYFFQLYPTHSRSVYNPTEMILAILYSKVPYMLHAKYQPNWHSSSGEEVVLTFFTIYGHGGISKDIF